MDKSYNAKLISLRQQALRQENDFALQLKLVNLKNQEISDRNANLMEEIKQLKIDNKLLHEQLLELNSNSMPKEQLDSLLTEVVCVIYYMCPKSLIYYLFL